MKKRKEQLLKALQKRMKEWEIESVYRDGESEGIPMDILTILVNEFGNGLTDVMGEFFFMPEVEGIAEDALRFNCIFTLSEQLDTERLPELYEAIGLLNFYTEAGTFAVDKAGNMLVYRNSIVLSPELDDATALEQITINFAFSMNVSERFADVLVRVNDGRLSMEEFRGLLPG